MIKGFTRMYKPLEIASEEQLEAIHKGSMDILETTGVKVEHEKALKLLNEHGCLVNFEEKSARIPASLVEECLKRVPSSYKIKARDSSNDLMVGGNTVYFMQGMGMRYFDLNTWETRPATIKDHREAMIVADALDNLHLADPTFILMEREGIPPCMVMLENLASGIRHSAKAQHFGYQQNCEIFAIKMAQELGVNLNVEVDTAAPLTFYHDAVEATFRYVEAGFPILPCIAITAGAEGPATLLGSLVLGNAQMMAFIVLVQIIKPGARVAIQHSIKPMDMERGSPLYGSVELALTTVITNQLLRRYQIPSNTVSGFASTSKTIDFQCGYEKSMGALISALSGASLQIFQGGSGSELLYNPVLSILDDDIAGWIGRFLEGVNYNDEKMAIDLIKTTGPIPGNYLISEHTRKWWREEQIQPKVADREVYPVWKEKGKKSAIDLAKEKMEDILNNHKPTPLTSSQEKIVENMLNDAREYYRKQGFISDDEWSVYMKALELTE